ncbi:MAG: DUF2920 family protein [Candidatus Omnitrophica bacterium]|nr:DUF2920 family protein [Candidatus Omnitrophota bacterium]
MKRVLVCFVLLWQVTFAWGDPLPPLPSNNSSVEIPTQEWPYEPGPRKVTVYLHYPDGELGNANENTGLMLSLHNWGGTHARGTADPDLLTNKYNVIAICVDYIQSGDWKEIGKPYDFGMYQAIDALRALHYVYSSLQETETPFNKGRIYSCGGSGGGNVTLMCTKFAPRTFACVIDMSGMAKLSDDIAYGEEGGSKLDAGYSRNPNDPFYLTPAAQELRDIRNPNHLGAMKNLGCTTHIIISHGAADEVCPATDARKMAANIQASGLSTESHFIEEKDFEGKTFTNTGHSVGDRTLIAQHFGDPYLLPDSEQRRVREGPNDFDLRDDKVRYEVTGGEYVVNYGEGAPVLKLETKQ